MALVIGNAGYRVVAELPNPRKDARDFATALRAAGFTEVVERYDLGLREMHRALARFEDKAAGAGWGVVYYAGHGIEVDGRNFLVPVDAELKRANDVEGETVALDRVLARVAAASKLQLVILDACRENPFKRRMVGAGAKRAVGERGLARIEPAHPNVIVAYAARDGEVALDGRPGQNSPYARALVKHLAEPGLELGRFFRKVRVDVLAATGGRQRPFEYGSLTEDLFFKPGAAGSDPAGLTPGHTPALPPARQSAVAAAWAAAKDSTSIPVLEAFRRQYGAVDAFYDRLAAERIEELKKRKVAAVTPPPVAAPPKVVEPAVAVTPELMPGRTFRDCPDCPEMVVVPAGSFTMGSPANEPGRYPGEGPQRRVTIARPFAVGKFEVTFAEWDACVSAGGCSHRPGDEGWGRGNRPVINVSWNDITEEYLPWLSRKAGKTYRLLSEAEWEYAARAGTTGRWSFDGDEARLCEYANHADQSVSYPWKNTRCNDGVGERTAEVGRYRPNGFGLHDMHGNVSEWVQDCVNENYNGAPSDGSARTAGHCSHRVLRGGSWVYDPPVLRSAVRFWDTPDDRSYGDGFRVGRTF